MNCFTRSLEDIDNSIYSETVDIDDKVITITISKNLLNQINSQKVLNNE